MSVDIGPRGAAPGITALRISSRCAAAADAARIGDLDGALTVLDSIAVPDDPGVLDLRARILAQRGDSAAANAAWGRLGELVPGHPGALAGRRALAGRGRRTVIGVAVVLSIAALAAAGLVGVTTPPATTDLGAPGRPAGPAVTAPAPLGPGRRDGSEAALVDLAAELSSPGARPAVVPAGVEVRFISGLFGTGTALTPAGRTALDRLADRLAGRDVTIEIVGRSVAVRGGPSSGGSMVGLTRAATTAERLAQRSGRPLSSFRVSAAEQETVSGPEAARARSVTVTVRPAA